MTEVGSRDIPPLNWDELETPGIPIATSDLPPDMMQAMFQAIASTLIYGKRDAVPVDAFMTVKQADDLVDWVAASGKNLTTIYITQVMETIGLGSVLLNASQMLKQSLHCFPNLAHSQVVANNDIE